MRGKRTGILLLTLSMGVALNLTASSHTICSVTLKECGVAIGHKACCAVDCCHEADEQDCCFVVPNNESDFLTPASLPAFKAPFLADLPPASDWFHAVYAAEILFMPDRSPDPPPRSGRALLSQIERRLV